MGIRTTVTLDEDVLVRVKRESRVRGLPFRETLNSLLRAALVAGEQRSRKPRFKVKATHMGYSEGLNYDDVESLLSHAEGEQHR